MAHPDNRVFIPISEDEIADLFSFKRIASQNQSKLLKPALQLANDPMFQATVERGMNMMVTAESIAEAQQALASIRTITNGLPLTHEVDGQPIFERLGEWFPIGAIEPAIDAVWRATKNKQG